MDGGEPVPHPHRPTLHHRTIEIHPISIDILVCLPARTSGDPERAGITFVNKSICGKSGIS